MRNGRWVSGELQMLSGGRQPGREELAIHCKLLIYIIQYNQAETTTNLKL